MSTSKPQTLPEEIANSITHGVGAALAVAAASVLVTYAGLFGDVWRVVSFSIYGASLVLLYLCSTLYHGFQNPRVKAVFHLLDHSAIYVLIAGSYTPFTLVNLRGPWGWSLFGIIWGLAIAGIIFSFFTITRFRVIPVLIYIGMGWLMVVAIKPMLANVSATGMWLLLIGGLSYTFGTIFYLWRRLPFNHAVWHLFVIGGSAFHFFAVFSAVLPMSPA